MTSADPQRRSEVRLLIATIVVSLLTLLVLARLRFPDRPVEVVEPAPAPLERLAAAASYDELAATMAGLDRRLRDSLILVRVVPDRPGSRYGVAVRVTPDRAVLFLEPYETFEPLPDAPAPALLFHDPRSGVAVLQVESFADRAVTPRSGTPRPGPRYVAVVDAMPAAPSLRPLYVGTTAAVQDERRGALLSLAAPPQMVPRGAPIFTLAGTFAGIAVTGDGAVVVLPGDALKAAAEGPAPQVQAGAEFGVVVQPLSPAIARVGGASSGVVIADVTPGGPAAGALQPGDIVQSIDGSPVGSVDEFVSAERSRTAGTPVEITFTRRRRPASARITPRAATPATGESSRRQALGLALRTVPRAGAEVRTVVRGSAGEIAGLRAGDLITAIDGGSPPAARDIEAAWAAASPGMLLTVTRGGERLVLALEKR